MSLPILQYEPSKDCSFGAAGKKRGLPDVVQEILGFMQKCTIGGTKDRVLLQSSASPIPLAVVKIDGDWRVDASPIIAFRKIAQET